MLQGVSSALETLQNTLQQEKHLLPETLTAQEGMHILLTELSQKISCLVLAMTMCKLRLVATNAPG